MKIQEEQQNTLWKLLLIGQALYTLYTRGELQRKYIIICVSLIFKAISYSYICLLNFNILLDKECENILFY
jgi:hypothetical protein